MNINFGKRNFVRKMRFERNEKEELMKCVFYNKLHRKWSPRKAGKLEKCSSSKITSFCLQRRSLGPNEAPAAIKCKFSHQ